MQAAAGLEQYIALDRADIAHTVKTALQQMAKPTKLMQVRVVRVASYLKNNPRLDWKYPYQQQPKSIDVFLDADFAPRETMLRSTSGVAEYYGKAPIKFASNTQSVRALSTGESEFYAITKGSAHSMHCQAILKGFGVMVEAGVLSDASAGIGIALRQGCGRLKHLEVKWLWVQEKVSEKALRLRKHTTETNVADLATKYLARPCMEMLLAAGNLVLVSGGREERSVHPRGLCPILGVIFMSVLSYAHDNQEGYQSGCFDGECDGTRLDKELGIAESKKAASGELEWNVGPHQQRCPLTGGRQ